MSTTVSWDEIKRLAADFQRVQLTETSLKLTEINCIELINKLIELDMLKVYHSIDGKEYITDKQLEQDIYDELYVHGGRINLCDLQVLLNIDITHIEKKTSEIVKNDPNLVTILGQIISKDYMNKLAEEINEMLQEKSRLTISEITTLYELPTAFILQILEPRVGSVIKANFDGNIFYTLNYVQNQKSLLSGALEACIKPIRMAQIVKEFNLESGMIFETFDALIAGGQIKGSLYGGRQEMSAVFVPEVYVKAQRKYVQSFFSQNGYVEYSSLKKIGVTEPSVYVHDLLNEKEIKYLSGSCFSSYKLSLFEEEIEDALNGDGYCDLSQILPSTLNENDLKKLAPYFSERLVSQQKHENDILQETYLISKAFLTKLTEKFKEKMEKKSSEDLKEPNIVLALRTERAIIAGSGKLLNQQEDSKKTKGKTKKSQQASISSDQNDNFIEISFVDKVSLSKDLNKMVKDINDDLLEALVDYFLKSLNHQYFDLLKFKIESGLINSSNEESGSSGVKGKNSFKEMQEKLKLFLINAKIFMKGIDALSETHYKAQDPLVKHLINTFFTDIINEMVKFLAGENMIRCEEENLTVDSRLKVIQKFNDPLKRAFNSIHQALLGKIIGPQAEQMYLLVEQASTDFFELSIKKQEISRRQKEVTLQLRESTKMSLEKETDAAIILQLTCILLYHQSKGVILNLPGRIVPIVLEALKDDVIEEQFSKLIKFQNLIIENLKESEDKTDTLNQILSLTKEVKDIGLNAKSNIKEK